MLMSNMRHIFIIVNPTSGKYNQATLLRFVERLQSAGLAVTVENTQYKGHATALARNAVKAGIYSHIIAGGGDGTIAEVSNGLCGSACILGILPIGTANVLAHELSIPVDELQNAENIISNVQVKIWPGEINKSGKSLIFLQMVGIGFDAYIVHNTSLSIKYFFGKLAYIISTIAAFFRYKFQKYDICIDGEHYLATTAIISKGKYYAGKYNIFQESSQEKKEFSILLFQVNNGIDLIKNIFQIFCPIPMFRSKCKFLFGSDISVQSIIPIPMQSDGDGLGFTPASIKISNEFINVASGLHLIKNKEN